MRLPTLSISMLLALTAVAAACSDSNDTATPSTPTPGPTSSPDAAPPPPSTDDAGADAAPSYSGYVYAASNDAIANSVVRYGRTADGKLVYLDATPTGDKGVGSMVVVSGAPNPNAVDPLFSNDSLVLSSDHTRLFVVNAGSDSVASFRVATDGRLEKVGSYPTGGSLPTGLALHGDTLYVSHAKANTDGKQLFGFKAAADGSLSAIANAAYAPSAATVITHALFSPNGKWLTVVELMTGMLDVYPVSTDGSLGTVVATASAAPGPFGAQFLSDALLLVTEVHPGAMDAGSVSSYKLETSGSLTPISTGISNGQNATCWLTATPDGKWVFASNTTSSNVSAYAVAGDGTLTLASASAATRAPGTAVDFMGHPSAGPVDAWVTADGKYFYQQYSGLGVVGAYRIGTDGSLTAIPDGDGANLPTIGAEGLAGY